MLKKLMIVMMALTFLAAPVYAASWEAESDAWGDQALGKLKYGLKNLLLGWTEILTEPYDAGAADESLIKGIGEGLWNGVADTVGGALHAVTAFLPSVDVPLPEGGTDILSR